MVGFFLTLYKITCFDRTFKCKTFYLFPLWHFRTPVMLERMDNIENIGCTTFFKVFTSENISSQNLDDHREK